MSKLITDITFDASAKTIKINGYNSIELGKVDIIYNVTRNIPIYNFALKNISQLSIVDNIITFDTVDTTGWIDTDVVRVFYNDSNTYQLTETLNHIPAQVCAMAGKLLGYNIHNTSDIDVYVHFYDCWYTNVVLGHKKPIHSVVIPARDSVSIMLESATVDFDILTVAASTQRFGVLPLTTGIVIGTIYTDVPTVERVGSIFKDLCNTGVLNSRFTLVNPGGGTFTPNIDGYVMVSGGSGNFTDYLYYNYFLFQEKFTIEIDTEYSGSTLGPSIGMVGSLGTDRFNASYTQGIPLGPNAGNLTIYRDPNATTAKASPVANAMPAVSTSDTFTIKFRRLNDNIILEVFNNATGQSYCNRYLVPTTGLAFNYMFYAALFAVSGTNSVKVTRFEVCDMGYKRPKSLFIGDSELYGYGFASLYNGVNYRYFTLLQNEAKGLLVANGIPGSRASHWNRAEVYDSLDLYKPEILTIALGLNDIAGGASAATAYAAIQAIIDRYKTSCIINVINISPLGSAVSGYVALNTTIDTVNASLLANTDVAHVFDINTLLKNGGSDLHASYDSGDGTHWNHLAHLNIKDLLLAANIY